MIRINIIKIIFIIIMISISNNNIIYGDEKINFDKISIKDGLSQQAVTCMMQDDKNMIWIGTIDGLNMYNGYEVQVYKSDENDPNTILDNYIIDIEQDNSKNIWVMTTLGISKIDYKTYTIKNYSNLIDGNFVNDSSTTDILITKNEEIIVSTTQGLNIYNEKKDEFEKILNVKLNSKYIYSMTQDNEQNIWISTKLGLTKISKDFKIIKQFNNKEQLNISTAVYKIYYDDDGYIWCGTLNSGLIKINIKNNNIEKFEKNENDKTTLQCNSIRDILKDRNGHVWICTDNGIAKYDEESNSFKTYKNKSYDNYSLSSDNTLSIMETNYGRIWIGTYSGISIFNYSNYIKLYTNDILDDNTINGDSVQSIYEDDDGLLWISIDKKGVDIMNREKDIVKHITSEDEDFLAGNNVNYITGYGDIIYLATSNGLIKINKKLGLVDIYTKNDGLYSNFITTLLLDSKGYLWIATTQGVNIMDTKSNVILDTTNIYKENKIDNKIIGDLFEDSEGNYYVGYIRNGGLIKLNSKDKSYKVYLYDKNDEKSISSNSILSITEDNDKNLWVGTRMGLNKLRKDSDEFIRYTEEDGLPNDTIYGILVEDKNNIWVSTNNGISRIDYKTNSLRNISVLDGLQSNEFNKNAYYKNDKGEFFFGGTKGLNVFNPNELKSNKLEQNLMIESFMINNKIYKTIDNMELMYDENNMEIKFYIPSYKNTNKTKYYYKLDGPNNNGEWISTNQTKLIYNDLPSGNYKFKLKAKGSDGSSSNEIEVDFRINPPIYRSSIAIFIYFLMILGLIYNHKNKIRRLDQLVIKKTDILKREIKLNDYLLNKTIDIEKSKSSYFVNLSHELRTPLNVINGTTQLVKNSNKRNMELSTEKVDYHMNVINKNCKQLLGLIDNIIDSTKLDHDTYIINFKNNEIVSLVEEAALGLKDYIESKGIEFVIDTDIEEKFIKCDKCEIERCVINLIGNARKFTPSGGIIKVCIKDLKNNIEIRVSDSGIGIEEKYLENIFNRFNQVLDKKKEAIKGGSGLGLTITKQIIIKHKGTIHAESELGKGSEFIIRLPIN